LVQGIVNLEEAAVGFAQGEYAQNMTKFFSDLDEKITRVNESVYENARAMQYNADVMSGLKDGLVSYAQSVELFARHLQGLLNLASKKLKTPYLIWLQQVLLITENLRLQSLKKLQG